MSLIACSVGFVSCKTFGKQPKHPCFGAKPPTGSRGGSPSNIAPARMPGVYAQGLYARTHTSGRTKLVQDAPTTNDNDCRDAEPTKHTQPFTGERGFRQGCRNKDTPSFKHGCLQVDEQSRCRTHRQQTTTVAQMQSHQSVLKGIGIINQKFISKNRLFLQAEFKFCTLNFSFLIFHFSFFITYHLPLDTPPIIWYYNLNYSFNKNRSFSPFFYTYF